MSWRLEVGDETLFGSSLKRSDQLANDEQWTIVNK